MRYAHRRDANERELIAHMQARGAIVEQLPRGPVDLLVCHCCEVVLCEVKGPRGVLTPGQVAFVKRWPADVYVVRSKADVDTMLDAMEATACGRH